MGSAYALKVFLEIGVSAALLISFHNLVIYTALLNFLAQVRVDVRTILIFFWTAAVLMVPM